MTKVKKIGGYPFVLHQADVFDESEVIKRSAQFYESMDKRRSVRHFSNKAIPIEVIKNIIKTASTAPSGAHKQPWTFAVVSNPALKKKIRIAAEEEEYESYNGRMTDEWLEDLRPLQTDWKKAFLEDAPYLIVVFKQAYALDNKGNKGTHYYVNESVGLAAGFLLTAIHQAGLVALTHTPSPMNFLTDLLERPKNERAVLLVPIGYAAVETYVPMLERKSLEEVAAFYE